MIEQVLLGLVGTTFVVGAFLAARRMAGGPVYYYGQTTVPKKLRRPETVVPVEVTKLTVSQVAELLARQPEVVAEALRAIRASEKESMEHVEAQAAAKMERYYELIAASHKAKLLFVMNAHSRFAGELDTTVANAEQLASREEVKMLRARVLFEGRRRDDLERRVRALEEKVSVPDAQADVIDEQINSSRIN